jgi:ribonucleoside-triphosphate reductase
MRALHSHPDGQRGPTTTRESPKTLNTGESPEDPASPSPLDEEGLFDAQMSLPLPSAPAPEPFSTVLKRDGREEPFNRRKIAEAIFRAAEPVGGYDRALADSLASAVSIYLAKRLGSAPPSVEQVHDATERVLIHMGHAQTALTYARYRDRRARIRRLREGDMRLLAAELEEAQRERDTLRAHGDRALFVRTSADTLTEWDRVRIAEALVRETGLERALADLVALEVEQQIAQAGLRVLTSSLVRELVGAKLIERGLELHRDRHRRLGVPLYDTERIVQGATVNAVGCDPMATDRVLAEAVKKEYALAEVFTQEVADAHLRGELHLHALGAADRIFRVEQSLDAVTALGVGMPGADIFAEPARYPDVLLAQWIKGTDLLEAHCAQPAGWDAVNFGFAPFVYGAPERVLAQTAQMMVYEFAYRALSHGTALPTEITLCWNTPGWLSGREAVGPGAEPTDRVYDDYEHTAQQLAWALVDVFRYGQRNGAVFTAPVLRVQLTEETFRAPGGERFLVHAGQLAAQRQPVHFVLERAPRAIGDREEPWQPQHAALHMVTLNLPRAAYAAGSEDGLWVELERLLHLAVAAHVQKRNFLVRLLGRTTAGPLGYLCRQRDGVPYFDVHQAWSLIGVEGLYEALAHLTGTDPALDAGAQALGVRILKFLADRCRVLGAKFDLPLALAQNNDLEVGARFASRDLESWPSAASTQAKERTSDQALAYTSGVRLDAGTPRQAMDVARVEGRWHPYLAFGAMTVAPMPDLELSENALADFLKKVWRQTGNRRIVFE